MWQFQAKACLFDMDGTLLDSSKSFDRIWGGWAARHGLNYADVASSMHGMRALDIVRRFAPHCADPQREADEIDAQELVDLADIVAVGGAKALLSRLPPSRWTIVTSASRKLATARLEAAGLPVPSTLTAADDVREGKPSPAGYQLAASQLNCDARHCVVFEDAWTGIEAGRAAGAHCVLVASGPAEKLARARAIGLPSIRSFDDIEVSADVEGLTVSVRVGAAI